MFGGGRGCRFGFFFSFFYAPFLASLERVARYFFRKALVVWVGVGREGEVGAFDVCLHIVISDFVFGSIAPNVVCDICP